MNRSLAAGLAVLVVLGAVVAASVLWLRGPAEEARPSASHEESLDPATAAAFPDAPEADPEAPAERREDADGVEDDAERVLERGPGEISVAGRVVIDGSGAPGAFAVVRVSARRPGFTAVDLRKELQQEFRAAPAAVHSMNRVGDSAQDELAQDEQDEDGAWSGFRAIETVAGEDGRFRLEGLPGRSFFVSVSLPRYRLVEEPWRELAPGEDEIVLTLAPAAEIRGRVTRAGGTPAAGAEVRIFVPFRPWDFVSGEMMLREPMEVTTGEDGSFTVPSVPAPAELQMVATQEGFAPSPQITLATEPGAAHEVALELAPGASLEVTVTAGNAGAVPGARVRLMPVKVDMDALGNDDGMERNETADDDGRVVLTGLPEGEIQVSARHGGYQPTKLHKVALTAGKTTELGIELHPGLVLRGRVAAPSGEPIPAARVRGVRTFSFTNFSFAADRDLTNWTGVAEDGTFALEGLPEGSFDLEIQADGWNKKTMKVEAGGAPVEVVLAPVSAIEGIVVSRMTGTSVTDFDLHVESERKFGFDLELMAETMRPPTVFPFVTEKGKFRVEDVPAGTYRLEVVAEGHARYRSDAVEVKDSEVTRGLVFYLEPESVLQGTVRDAVTQELLAGVRIDTRQGSVNPIEQVLGQMFGDAGNHTDAEGSFRVGGLSAGEYTLVASHTGYAEATLPGLRVGRGETHGGIAVSLGRGGEIFGTVFDGEGTPGSGVSLFAGDATGTRMKSAKTDAAGGYRISGLAPGRYSVTRMPSSFSLDAEKTMEQFAEGYETKSVELEAGQAVQVDFGVKQRGAAELHGLVRQKGEPAPGLVVVAVTKGDPIPAAGGGGRTSFTDAAGKFTFKNLEPGQVLVQVQVNDTSFMMPSSVHVKELELGPGVHEVVFDLPAGEIKGVLRDASTRAPAAGVPVYASQQDAGYPRHAMWSYQNARGASTRSQQDGTFVLKNVAAGSYVVSAGGSDLMQFTRSGYALTQVSGVRVPVSGGLDLGEVLLQKEGAVTGNVRSTTGEPVPSASIFLRSKDGPVLEAFSTVATDAGGTYEYSGVPEGTYTVICKAPGFSLAERADVRVRRGSEASVDFELAGGTDVYLVFSGAGSVEGPVELEVTGPRGTLVSGMFGFADMVAAVFDAVEPGVYYLGNHEAGTYHARGSLDGKPFAAEFELKGEAELRIPVKAE